MERKMKWNENSKNRLNQKQYSELEDGEIIDVRAINQNQIEEKNKNPRKTRGKSSSSSSSSSSSESASSSSKSQSFIQKQRQNKSKDYQKRNYQDRRIKSRSPNKLDCLCRNFLRNRCNLGKKCNLSHDLKHYPCYIQNLFGQCTQQSCQFDHGRDQSTNSLIKIFEDHQMKVFELLEKGRPLKCPKSVRKWIEESFSKKRRPIILDDSPFPDIRTNYQPIQPILIPQKISMPQYLSQNDQTLKSFQKIIDSDLSKDPKDSAIQYMVDKYKELFQKEFNQMLCPIEAIKFIRECVINREVSSSSLEKLLLSEQKKIPIIKILKILNLNTYKATLSINQQLQRDLYLQASQEGDEVKGLIGTYIAVSDEKKISEKKVEINKPQEKKPEPEGIYLIEIDDNIDSTQNNNMPSSQMNQSKQPVITEELKAQFRAIMKSKKAALLFQK